MKFLLISALSSVTCFAGQGFAQSVSPVDATTSNGDDIVVTAQRRLERERDVPISIDTISQADLVRFGGQTATDLQFLSPSLQVTHDNFDNFAIRGVGTTTTGYGVDQAVSTVVDDVVIAMPTDLGISTLSDIQQVEVLRGPQGTLFGKNSTAGVVNVRTIAPKFDAAYGDLTVDYGERDTFRAVGSLNLPLTSNLALRVSGTYQRQDGFMHNILENYYQGGATDRVVRAKLLWQPSDQFELYVIGDYASHEGSDSQFTYSLYDAGTFDISPAIALGIRPGRGNYETAGTVPTTATAKRGGVSVRATYHAEGFDITSISAYRELKNNQYNDLDTMEPIILEGGVSTDTHQITQELRLATAGEQKLQFQGGLFYFYRSGYERFINHGTIGFPLPPDVYLSYAGGLEQNKTTYRSMAGYVDATYALTEKLKLTGGMRYTFDRVTQGYYVDPIVPNWIALGGPPITLADRLYSTYSKSRPSGRAILQYAASPDLSAYASYARGYKGPAIQSGNGGQYRVDPETVDSFEIGLKGAAFDGKLTFDLAAFYAKYKDFQAQAYDPTTFQVRLTNAGGQRTKGVELGLNARPVRPLTLSLGVAYTDAKFTDYLASCYDGQASGCDTITGTTQAAGSPLPNSAKWTLTGSANFVQPLPSGMSFDAGVNAYYKSKSYAVGYDPNTLITGYALVNLNTGLTAADNSWRIGLFARNLFDETVVASVMNIVGLHIASYSPESRRTFGVTFKVSSCALGGAASCGGQSRP